jgi:chromosome segregation ATPase
MDPSPNEGSDMPDNETPRLKRRLFGYRTADVRDMLSEREGMFARAQHQLRETQASVEHLQARLQALEQHAQQRTAEVETAASRIAHLEVEVEQAHEQLQDREELQRELHEARRRLRELEDIRVAFEAAREQLREHEGVARELQAELDRRGEQVRMAESRVGSLEGQLAGVRGNLEQRARVAESRATELGAELAGAREELRARAEAPPAADTSEQVSAILDAAERAAIRIIDLAGTTHREQVEQMDRMRAQVREETEQLAGWRRQLDPIVRSIQSSMDRARARISDVPDRIRDALEPVGEAMESVNDQLNSLAEGATHTEDDQRVRQEPRSEAPPEDEPVAREPEETTAPEEPAAPVRPLHAGDEVDLTNEGSGKPGNRPGWHYS